MKPSFEWDLRKDSENQEKHGVTFELAQRAFADPHRLIFLDEDHSGPREQRFFCVGKVGQGILTVRFTLRGETIRIIGAGYWRKTRRLYETKD